MRQPRLKGIGPSFYHCVAETLPRLPEFDKRDMSGFAANLRRLERFSGLEVITWSMTNKRIRLLVFVPTSEDVTERALYKRLREYYPEELAEERIKELKRLKRSKAKAEFEQKKSSYISRMGNLANFLKTLLQMLVQSYNPRHDWKGTIFRERFRSILIEDWETALMSVAAYIDLDPLRSGLCADPKAYRYSGFGSAVAGNKLARERLMRLGERMEEPPADWRSFVAHYRTLLYPAADSEFSDRNRVLNELDKRSPRLPIAVLLRCHVRYFDYGGIIGRPEFISSVHRANRRIFPAARQRMSYKFRFGNWNGLHSMRNPVTGLIDVSDAFS